MAKFFGSSFFINFVIPFVSVLLGIFIKVVSRDDSQLKVKREDLAIGFELAIGSLFAFTTYSASMPNKLASVTDATLKDAINEKIILTPWVLIFWGIGLIGVSTLVRVKGWEDIGGKKEPTKFCGISIPLVYGIVSLMLTLLWIGN